MNKIDKQYQNLLKDILENGITKQDRTGTGTISVFGRQIRHKMSEGFPLLTTKKMAFKSMVTELLWFLQGDTNIKYLVDNGCNIWNGDAYKKYKEYASNLEEPDMSVHVEDIEESKIRVMTEKEFIDAIKNWPEFSKKWGELGPVYGKQWRKWQGWLEYKNDEGKTGFGSLWFDQILRLIADLQKNPDSRRLMVNAWNVAEINQMTLPPCHYGFQVYTRELTYKERYDLWFINNYETGMEKNYDIVPNFDDEYYEPTPTRAISLMWNQRSVDTFLGLPFNIASYGLLLLMLAKRVNMVPDELIGNLGDTHLYLNHLEQAKEQIGREPMKLPRVELDFEYTFFDGYITEFDKIDRNSIKLVNYQSHPEIKAPLSN